MAQICIQIPPLERAKMIELEVKIDGKTHLTSYRVESFDWGAESLRQEERIQRLRRLIRDYDAGWELVQIGTPHEHLIPVMFRQRTGSRRVQAAGPEQ